MTKADVIIVGSGASAAHVACPLVEAGLKVLMLDVGELDERYAPLIPEGTFSHIRRTDQNQHRYFLGDSFEGVPFGGVRVGAQLTPPRSFITRRVDELTPVVSKDFIGMESLALGGLAAGWGAGLARFDDGDLQGVPLTAKDLAPHYAAVEARIGVAADDDDLSPVLGKHESAMPSLRLDTPCKLIMDRYTRDRTAFHAIGLRMGVSRLAACSKAHNGRGPHSYDDMDFWSDRTRSIYRPCYTIEGLKARENFTYLSGRLVQSFRESTDGVRVRARRVDATGEEEFHAKAVVMGAGVFGTARIVLRSLGCYDTPVGFVCDPSSYAPCINLNMLGKTPEDERHSLSQLSAVLSPPQGSPHGQVFASFYSYRSLLTFKLMKETPLSARAALRVMRALIPIFTVVSLQHADYPTPEKNITLRRDPAGGPDWLHVQYALSKSEESTIRTLERRMFRCVRRLGILPLKRIYPGHGASVHYAGTLPMKASPRDLQCSPDGLLAPTRSVYIADGSTLPHLTSKALTLTLMANAHRIGTQLAQRLA